MSTLSELHAPWSYAKGNDKNPYKGEVRDNRGVCITSRVVMNAADERVMHALSAAPELLHAAEKSLHGIKQLCDLVNGYANNPKKVRYEDFAELLTKAIAKAKA